MNFVPNALFMWGNAEFQRVDVSSLSSLLQIKI